MTRILIADDHPLYRQALMQAVRGVIPDALLDEADDLEAARNKLSAQPDTDLVLLDLHMPGSHGLMGLVSLREFPHRFRRGDPVCAAHCCLARRLAECRVRSCVRHNRCAHP